MNVAEWSSHEHGGTVYACSRGVVERPRERFLRLIALREGGG
jgi:hypothetical protein